jgi:putative transposase
MPQSLHILSAHTIFSTKERQPWLSPTIRKRVWTYQSRILQTWNAIPSQSAVWETRSVLCNLTKKSPTAKVLEILKKDLSKLIKTLGVPDFHWQDGDGLFSVSPSHFEAVRKYILDQEEHYKE